MSVQSKPNREGEAPAEPEHGGSELPEGWASGRLDSFAELNPRHPSGLDDSQFVTFVPMPSMSGSCPDFDRSKERLLSEVRKGYTHFAEGDVLFAKITPCMENGKGAVATGLKNGLGCGTTELHVVRPLCGIDPHYVYRFLQQESIRRDAAANFTGSAGQLRVPMSFIADLELPIAPLAEQERIVGKLALLLGKVSSSQQRLSRVPGLLKRFRQSVLAAACSGKLTADWREENEDVETALELLGRLQSERRETRSRNYPDRNYQEPARLDEEDLATIPDTWVWTNFDHCASEITVGHVGPMKDRYVDSGVTFLRSQNVRPLRFDAAGLVYIPKGFQAELTKSKLIGGEILVVRSGANTGDCCVFPRGMPEANCSDLVITRPLSGLCSAYGAMYVASPIGQAAIGLQQTGIAQPHFNIGAMKIKPFPLPPLSEQQEIVRRVEKLFAFADLIEARLRQAQAHVDRITQSLLRKAFRGELVPTEHTLATAAGRDYESASELLAQIQAERNSTTAIVKPKRKRVQQSRGTRS